MQMFIFPHFLYQLIFLFCYKRGTGMQSTLCDTICYEIQVTNLCKIGSNVHTLPQLKLPLQLFDQSCLK